MDTAERIETREFIIEFASIMKNENPVWKGMHPEYSARVFCKKVRNNFDTSQAVKEIKHQIQDYVEITGLSEIQVMKAAVWLAGGRVQKNSKKKHENG